MVLTSQTKVCATSTRPPIRISLLIGLRCRGLRARSSRLKPTTPPAKRSAGKQSKDHRTHQCQLNRQTQNSSRDEQSEREENDYENQGCGGCNHFNIFEKVGCLRFPVGGLNRRLNVSAHVKVACNLYAQRIARVHEIFEDHVDDVLVKDLYVAKRIDIELQAF